MQEFLNRVIHGDCSEIMQYMPSESVDLTVTSPPYDNLRKYNGFEWDFEGIAKELFRITKDGGIVVWVVKDSTNKGNKSLTSFKQCIFFQEIGFNVYDVMIYSKTSGGLPHKRRYRDAFEYMFVLSKGRPSTVNLIKDRRNKYGGTSTGKVTVRERDGQLTRRKERTVEEFGYRYNIWEYATGNGNTTADRIAFEHPAIFPERLAEDHILSWSNPGDVVLDPMCGSGTTLKMAYLNNRNYIGIDYSTEYVQLSKRRVELAKRP